MLSTILPGSKPSAERMTPTRTHSSTRRKNTESGGPPRKRLAVFGMGSLGRSSVMAAHYHESIVAASRRLPAPLLGEVRRALAASPPSIFSHVSHRPPSHGGFTPPPRLT